MTGLSTVFRHRSSSPEETQALAERIGRLCATGAVIALTGDLGSGKTAFVQGLARGMGVSAACPVTSPSYTLVNQYSGTGGQTLCHIDLYRLVHPDQIEDLGTDELMDGDHVTAIEWAHKFGPDLWKEDIDITLDIVEDTVRDICVAPRTAKGEALVEQLIQMNS
ncbi:protein of unknown function UPF0079 [Desulfosudis oleivorans Hxd3]|uniref:tRNA threonylcarbamoyladenosine biosynthesis protein TsaE n=1 Tax=Desulfosudis oleivorans (strain DSM 6200 / JCM 39069 / Hxd3) TaxID=96561 RepID=A8ZVC3_DESOH|nr:protein of unknown function UPF0079 [Desulfosudis oleivorans Hxd3]